MYEEMGVSKDRILIKLAGTWEGVYLYLLFTTGDLCHVFLTFLTTGIQAARILEKEGIQCNITLVFSFLQAAAAAQAGAYLISPFPGRILDWHKKQTGKEGYPPDSDPGVLAVKRMYSYFRKYNYKTICMPASWRPSRGASVEGSDVDEILALAGVDEMTIPEPLLDSLSSLPPDAVTKQCDAVADGASCTDPDFKLTEESYKKYWGADDCGQEKLKEGIDAFTVETEKLIKILIEKF
jgi:transaldolase